MAPQIANPDLKRVPMAKGGYGRWLRAFLENRAVSGPVRTFPQAERPLLEAQDIRSLLAVPVFWEGRLWGFLGVDEGPPPRLARGAPSHPARAGEDPGRPASSPWRTCTTPSPRTGPTARPGRRRRPWPTSGKRRASSLTPRWWRPF
ncbi:MAG TPA: GAF domain-containing protein [Thermus sp.]|uniref:GAF domain-containing protein n=1 Tax=Thermus thermophilus (strain ATCC 27634 / DSM 579 / HB8) TaxID=300852 RepID=Q5SJL8_THET8|nr:hypothetical protein [Thermus thermophilus HB8]HAH40798.1 GAF domain-containing protein [Thermus sp.]